MVEEHSDQPWLLRGERSALAACFREGLRNRRVLDLGCGAGRVLSILRDRGADPVGLDVSHAMLRAGHRRFPSLDLCGGDAASLGFADGAFDLVICGFNVLDYLHPKRRRLAAVEEVKRVTRPGGYFVFSHHNLGALVFGWYNSMRPRKLWFRARQIVRGRVFLPECFIWCHDGAAAVVCTYFGWPGRVIADMRRAGFELRGIHPNSALLAFLQRWVRTDALTRLADPWPYYVFRKPVGMRGAASEPAEER